MIKAHQVHRSPARFGIWLLAAPIPNIDGYLLAIRWVALLGVSIITLGLGAVSEYEGRYGEVWLGPIIALPIVVGFNLVVSVVAWQKKPLASGQAGWLLLGDITQAALFTTITGGISSSYFILFPLAAIEAGLVLYWQAALMTTIGLAVLHGIVAGLNPAFHWDSLAVAILAAKSFVILTLGALVTLFSNQLQQETASRRAAALAAARSAALNEIFLHLAEGSLELDQIVATILDGTRVLPAVEFSLVLLPDSPGGQWRVAASTTSRYAVAQRIDSPDWGEPDPAICSVGAGTGYPLPDFVAADNIERLICARLISPGGDTLGMIVAGQETDRPLGESDRDFLRALAAEAGLALRNAYLYAREQEQVARLRQFEERQSVFFSAIGHELKTPLTVLKTLTPALRQLPDLPTETQGEITGAIEQNLSRLELLITDFLESSRLEAKAIALHRRAINLTRRVQRVVVSLLPLLERRRQQVELKIDPALPRVWADGRRVEQILSNLLNNATKFAPVDSTIELELSSIGDTVRVCVTDAGPGVPLDQRERVFEKFYIAATDKALAGVGLGLFICRELVRLHGGEIWIETGTGGGSRFCFTLPVVNNDSNKSRSQTEPQSLLQFG
jgi:signal transduction histidine kinase